MNAPRFVLRAFINPSRAFVISLYGWVYTDGRPSSPALPVVFQETQSDASNRHTEPMLDLEPEEAQVLVDSLWEAGIRPAAAAGSAGQLAAVERHLEDVRKLSARLLDEVLS